MSIGNLINNDLKGIKTAVDKIKELLGKNTQTDNFIKWIQETELPKDLEYDLAEHVGMKKAIKMIGEYNGK